MHKLFMLLIGCTPGGRNIEQHDVFFGIGETIKDLIPAMIEFWPEAKGKLHIDAWREVTTVNGHSTKVIQGVATKTGSPAELFFINLGGYKPGEFEEFHYKMIIAAANKTEAIGLSKETAFFKHTGFRGANSHIDDKYGIDVDDVFEITDILSKETKEQFHILVTPGKHPLVEDEIHLGYFKLGMFQ